LNFSCLLFLFIVQTVVEAAVPVNPLNISAEVQTDMQQTDSDVETQIHELTVLVTQLQDDNARLGAELSELNSQRETIEQLTNQSISEASDTSAGHQGDIDRGSSKKTKKELSATKNELSAAKKELLVISAQIEELKSTVTVQETELSGLSEDKRSLQRQLDEMMVDLQSTEADCRQLQDTIADLKQQLAAGTQALEEARDREDDLQKAVEASVVVTNVSL